jgi:hypothetical protein
MSRVLVFRISLVLDRAKRGPPADRYIDFWVFDSSSDLRFFGSSTSPSARPVRQFDSSTVSVAVLRGSPV